METFVPKKTSRVIATNIEREKKKSLNVNIIAWVEGGGGMEIVLLFNFKRNVFMFVYCLMISWSDVQRHRVDDIERHLHKMNINLGFEALFGDIQIFDVLNCRVSTFEAKSKVVGNCFGILCLFGIAVGGNIERDFFLLQLSVLKGQTNFD